MEIREIDPVCFLVLSSALEIFNILSKREYVYLNEGWEISLKVRHLSLGLY